MTNAALAAQVADAIEEYPDLHRQTSWFEPKLDGAGVSVDATITEDRRPPCGTTACAAGWVVFLTAPLGARLAGGSRLRLPDGELVLIEDYAVGQLDVRVSVADELFSGGNSREGVVAGLRYLAAHPDATSLDIMRAIGRPDDDEYEY